MKDKLRIRLMRLLAAGMALLLAIGFGMNPGPEIGAALNGITAYRLLLIDHLFKQSE